MVGYAQRPSDAPVLDTKGGEQHPAMLLIDAQSGRLIDANAAAAELYGCSRKELLGRHYTALGLPALLEADEHSSCMVLRADGQQVEAELDTDRLQFPDGGSMLVATLRDLTERRRAELQIRKLSRAVEQSPEVVLITDPTGTIDYVNPAFVELTGFSVEEAVGQKTTIQKSGQTEPEVYLDLWKTINCGQVWRGEFCNRKKNGELYWESAVISPILDSGGTITHFVAVKQDITERKRLERELRQAMKMEAIGQLAGGIAHDFNNILAAQLLNLSTLLERDDLSAEVKETLEDIESGAKLAADLTRQLLAFGRRQALQVERVDVTRMLGTLLKLIRHVVGEQIEMVCTLASEPLWIEADPGMLEQVMMSLAVTARNAMPRGGRLSISTSSVHLARGEQLRHPEAKPGHFVCLSMTDTGAGIDPELAARLFEPFFNNDFKTAPSKSAGLGLATVHGIVRQHHGWIEVDSQPSQGTTFRVFWSAAHLPPLAKAEPQQL